LTPRQIELVQRSWAKVEPIEDAAADIFYSRLFEVNPSYRELFPKDMTKQKKALMNMLGAAVNGITEIDELIPQVRELGRRHGKVWK
jgi:hemoglobin-like flavoprotein